MKTAIERRITRLEGDTSGPCLLCLLERVGTGISPPTCPHAYRPTFEELLSRVRGRPQPQDRPKTSVDIQVKGTPSIKIKA
jgi:hypothetical protein